MISTRAFVSYATWGRKQLVFDKSCKSFSCSNCDNRRSRLLHSNSLSHRRQASLHLCATQQPSKLLERVKFDSNGLVPVVAQQYDTQEVLMLAWMDRQALLVTLKEGRACYYSRSRKSLWRKGETSGQVQWLKDIYIDCDGDSVLIKVDQKGVACHTGRRSCFFL
ncbi:bifunctional phosphoribosyl-ATP diphosphatase / phosphoribosyl-AMPcyclohydrolase isoform 1 [Galdieria sulphuraria]|uniref:Histidine biosynthesis bifunctional protein HisIE n=1 Tax=Galdieria sulphuraria TaxID=130081 RepID=M2Y6R4_GALSU|nr:bifunctional phosphoribosyl-ATP diphosphatase / phosphoribosyl-AMPcyclohydrolase isoform 2 [Galdieria sulphuraria]XP_005708249.1 bifunctional phosphoribosyl-ATP diphosphatase / phosphoribosyl-AMPcyclohydrolase isoform 1 [Galdieria sulphuraria]EME31728.1 bifunctional phosphoribosyl-ATP diphosphatase / phosphoribosyl-AMPcyclohydrolase isoform 2 [Galdieria sulphuraria]EME31729.1 bifunctional phosphoribosyl-ATP diphosphatase / phosphoribosyl-AMPcyclohydrolase isoform 1 [Galdieria sulphuraria]|eukprot:XP_005708248.1 bifunctional phosphoribosyl-ATP diphosphatase / phosphoribosyl-AMPcyclohydrolase isoform 2 [Galdieria sulphuraria]